jgi:predicted acyl esterase
LEWAIYQLEAEKEKENLASLLLPSSTDDRYQAATCTKDIFVPMRDGIRLCTDIYRPAGEEDPLPVDTVADNIGFGLVERKIPKSDIKKKVSEKVDLVNLVGLENRYPD